MNKIVLVDGNNLLFRSYYATAYSGNFMRNSKGFPTNALLGFANMINKIIDEEKPEYIIVAFDKGKTFRHKKYDFYKGERRETPDELKIQFPIAKDMLDAMGITYYEIDNYEADDIIGTFAKYCDDDPEFIGTIVSSDKDLLQLISSDIDIKLLKQKDYIRYDLEGFKKEYGIDPINIIDLKALMGDASDNIPGVKGVGEKTALKLLREYKTIDNLYNHIDEIKGKLKDKLVDGKKDAYMSYEIATIVKTVPIDITMSDLVYKGINEQKLIKIYDELEFKSLIKKLNLKESNHQKEEIKYKVVEDPNDIKLTKDSAIYLEVLGVNYHTAERLGLGLYNDVDGAYFIPEDKIVDAYPFFRDYIKYTYDFKKLYVTFKWYKLEITNKIFDTMIAAYLLDYSAKEDPSYLASDLGYNLDYTETVYGKNKRKKPDQEVIAKSVVERVKFIYDIVNNLKEELKTQEVEELFYDIEMPLARTLGNMEYSGVCVNKKTLDNMGEKINESIDTLTKEIYDYAECEFNISSPRELGNILFEKLGLTHGKKNKLGYSTSIDVLNKLRDKHPIVNKVLDYRMLTKLYSTYIEGLKNTILNDGKIHTIYTQTLTRTGRLSSIEPNLQNIPVRNEYGRMIRKAFVPSEDSILISSDYSQIELRVFAHIANNETLIDAFRNNLDIHAKTAADILRVDINDVTKEMRRIAKAVNFGIIYGISSFGLSENVGIPVKEAKKFMNDYFAAYPGIKDYMEKNKEEARLNGYVKTIFNRKRLIPEINDRNFIVRNQGERIALNTPIQGSAADIMKKAMNDVALEFKKNDLKSKLILQVHDEIIIDCKKDEKDIVVKILKEKMENAYKLSVPLKVDINIGNTWYEAK